MFKRPGEFATDSGAVTMSCFLSFPLVAEGYAALSPQNFVGVVGICSAMRPNSLDPVNEIALLTAEIVLQGASATCTSMTEMNLGQFTESSLAPFRLIDWAPLRLTLGISTDEYISLESF
jgi:hypothetical protein